MRGTTVVLGILAIIFGLACVLYPSIAFTSIGWVLGVVLFVIGINLIGDYISARKIRYVSGWDLFGGIVTVIMAILICGSGYIGFITEMIIVFAFCAWIVISGFVRIFASIHLKWLGARRWLPGFLFGILNVLLGALIMFYPAFAGLALGVIIGFAIMLQGLGLIAFGVSMESIN